MSSIANKFKSTRPKLKRAWVMCKARGLTDEESYATILMAYMEQAENDKENDETS